MSCIDCECSCCGCGSCECCQDQKRRCERIGHYNGTFMKKEKEEDEE